MGYSVYSHNGRWAGYGVPAICDEPSCSAAIDRGLAYACGGGPSEDVPNCGLFFCGDHLNYVECDDESGERQGFVCARCAASDPPFEPKPDTVEWVNHMLTDDSWQQWRGENPEQVSAMHKLTEKV
jgi:hypothetical protein